MIGYGMIGYRTCTSVYPTVCSLSLPVRTVPVPVHVGVRCQRTISVFDTNTPTINSPPRFLVLERCLVPTYVVAGSGDVRTVWAFTYEVVYR